MRRVSFQKSAKGRANTQTYSLPAPVGGLNTRDSRANMSELDAILMDNWFPETNDVRVRKGSADHVTGIGAQVESLMPYNAPDGTTTLFAATPTDIYNVTSAGAVGAAVVSSQSNGRWNHVNFTNSSGTTFLCNFNGADSPQYWNGTSWITITGVSSPAITGITTSTIINAEVHKRRMWLVAVNSLKAFYLPVDSVGGAVKFIDLGGIAYLGGFIMAIGTWTLDAGEGADDYWAAITSEGQVVVYRGTDPTSSSTWSLHGVWNIGNPIGRRCIIKYNGDLLLLTIDGIMPLSKLIVSAQTDPNVAITNKIEKSISDAANNYKTNFGWQMLYFAQADMVLLNIPVAEGSAQIQFAMNTITGSWGGPFRSLTANCWAMLNEEVYFGDSGKVVKFWGSLSDNGANIVADGKQAENYFETPGRLKYFKALRPIISSDGFPAIGVKMNINFEDDPINTLDSFVPTTVGVWDVAVWDTGVWGGATFIQNSWLTSSDVGTSAGFRLKTSSSGIEVRWESSDHLFEFGGVIG